jgi:hypothetical protein
MVWGEYTCRALQSAWPCAVRLANLLAAILARGTSCSRHFSNTAL